LQWATAVLAAAENGSGAQRVAGQMIDRPVIERARQLMARGPDRSSS
jgi:citrate lyase beta subunit